jgi:hypothetical protein
MSPMTRHMTDIAPAPLCREGAALAIDPAGFATVERLLAYEMANALMAIETDLQAHLGLRPEERQVFMVIVIATVQRFAREQTGASPHTGADPLPRALSGHISRRRVAESLGLPLETVRRHVVRLQDRGLVVEPARGQLQTPSGTLRAMHDAGVVERVARQFLGVARSFERLGALGARG